eukprot:Gb_36750 [translate_table: standard]
MDQGMERAKVMISRPSSGRDTALRAIRSSGILLNFVRDTLRWKCIESKVNGKCLHYGRFALSPLQKGQANIIFAMRRDLLGEVEGICIKHAKFENMTNEYFVIMGIEESLHDISINLRCILKSDPCGIREASIYSIGPKDVIAQEIILPPSVRIIDTTQHIASLKESITSDIRSQIRKDRGYRIQSPNNSRDGIFSTDVVSMLVQNTNYSIHSYGNGNEMQEILFPEIWTNGSLAPGGALYEASCNLIDLFIPFMHAEE